MLPFKIKPRILCDEHIPIELLEILKNEGFDTVRVELCSKDRQIFELAKSEGRILITSDKHFLNKEKFPPRESSGIIFLQLHPPLIESMQFSLNKLFKKSNLQNLKEDYLFFH